MTRNLLFVCGASTGGAFRSTLELAQALQHRGHCTQVLVERAGLSRSARVTERLLDAEVRLGRPTITAVLGPLRRHIGTRARPVGEPTDHLVGPIPENAVPRVAARLGAEAVVVTSIRRPAWRQIRAWCAARGVLSVLYMRGVSELDQLTHPDGEPDLLLCNTESIADQARRVGHHVEYVPSLVDLARASTETSREVALLVSPTELQGVDTALMLAAARPDVRFALQQSWDLDAAAAGALQHRLSSLPNVELRARTPHPSDVYRDARVLLAPHRIDNRPRVILEAQANGIPVLASAQPGLLDQMGDGGVAVAIDAGPGEWAAAFSSIWDDESAYSELCRRARLWADRPEQREAAIVDRFEAVLDRALVRSGHPASGSG